MIFKVEEWVIVDITVEANPWARQVCQGPFNDTTSKTVQPTRSSSTTDTFASGRVYKRTSGERRSDAYTQSIADGAYARLEATHVAESTTIHIDKLQINRGRSSRYGIYCRNSLS